MDPMDLDELEEQIGYWRGNERTLIRVFLVLFLAVTIVEIAYDIVFREVLGLSFYGVILGIGQNLVVAYAFTSFVLGIVFIWAFRKEGVVPLRELLGTMAQVAVVVAIFFSVMFLADLSGWSETGLYEVADGNAPYLTGERSVVATIGFFVLTLGGTLLAQVVILVGGFGIMGMIFTFEVGGTPKLIERMEGITGKEDIESKAIMWFFGIPGALDTDVVLVDEPVEETTFPWDRFRTAVLWQVAFGIIIGIYVSLNPWLLRTFSMDQLFRFMSTAFVVLPFLVIPWFIHRRLNARFKGVNQDFHFYKAFKDRLTGLLIAGGTLLIFLKFAWESSSLEEILAAFSSYIFVMVLCIIAFTFIYFNFFENKLAHEVHERWAEARARSGMGVGTEEGEDGGDGLAVSEQDVSSPRD
jgi:hypothetical protein